MNRREFLKLAGAGSVAGPAAISALAAESDRANGKVHHVSFGGNGMALKDVEQFAKHPKFHLYAVVDVDKKRAQAMLKKFPDAKFYWDWREFFAKEADNFESCNVSIPDHMHASVAMSAMRHGKNVYCQKPLCHNLHEVRALTEAAAERPDLATQMGIQIHSYAAYRMARDIVQRGDIGKVRQVYFWSNKGSQWGRTDPAPAKPDAVPEHLKWNYWLGVAPARRFVSEIYHPDTWREWQDFGTGQLGDMACHIIDPVYMGLELGRPQSVQSFGPTPVNGAWPKRAQIHWQFDPTSYTASDGVEVIWTQGGIFPPKSVQSDLGQYSLPGQGSLWLGDQGTMVLPHVSQPRLFPRKQFRDYEYPEPNQGNHWHLFLDACMGKGEPAAPFSYSGPLTETVLMGTIAWRFPGQSLEWNAEKLRFANSDAANDYLSRTYRAGWHMEGLG